MKYSLSAHIINILFIGIFAVTPIIYCFKNTSISDETFRLIFFFTFLFGALIFADWYHIYFTNTFKSIGFTCVLGVFIAAACLVIASKINDRTIFDLISFKVEAWRESHFLMRFFIVGVGIAICAMYSIPRLFLIKIFTKDKLPGTSLTY
jgi:hypothetical protein